MAGHQSDDGPAAGREGHPPRIGRREIASLILLEANVRNQHPNLLGIDHVGQTAQYLFYVMDPADDITGRPASSDAAYRPCTLNERLRSRPFSPDDCSRSARQLRGRVGPYSSGGHGASRRQAGELPLPGRGLETGRLRPAGAGRSPKFPRRHPKYMPPDGHMDARHDVYAAGLVSYEMLSGLPAESFPHLGQRASEVAKSPLLRGLNRLILRACQPDPKLRFADAQEMLGQWPAAQAAAAETEEARRPAPLRRRILLAMGCLLAAIVVPTIRFWPSPPPAADISFITQPFGARIYLDGKLLVQPDGTPYTTPCTVPGVPARSHRVSFQRADAADLDVGQIDMTAIREVTARWDTGAAAR